MKASLKIALVGSGPLSQAIARILESAKVDVHMYARSETVRNQLRETLKGVTVDHQLDNALDDARIVFLAIPADQLMSVANRYGDSATGDQIVITASRGVGPGFQLPHEMIRAKTCVRKIGILGGPINARELAAGRSINAVLASRFPECIEAVRSITDGTPIALHASRDIIGVQIAGAISNVSSIAAGMAEALKLGDTARGMLMTHGLVDARKLGVASGGLEQTFSGLAGVGELIPRHVTSMDRHVAVGRLLAEGKTIEDALAEVAGHVEGVTTAREATARARTLGLSVPLVEAVEHVITQNAKAKDALEAVLQLRLDLDTRQAARA